jgi:O-methyltransferase involved in polyketide biosynthesis
MKISNTLSESAFLVNESRARRVDISHDIYASLWTTDATHSLWEDFSKKVYTYDDIELSLRNRFFLDNLNSYIHSTDMPIFINISAGFTSYPFLVSKTCRCLEVDLDHIIEFKRERVKSLIRSEKLPDRDIEFIAADLCRKTDVDHLQKRLCSFINNNTSFILLEGVTYYLDKSVLDRLIDTFSIIQTTGSFLAFDFWDPGVVTNPVFRRFIQFFDQRFGHKKTQYNLFNVDYINLIKGYTIEKITDIQKLEKKYLKTGMLENYEQILPENYVVLRRE